MVKLEQSIFKQEVTPISVKESTDVADNSSSSPDCTLSDGDEFNVTEEDSIISLHSSFYDEPSSNKSIKEGHYTNLTISGLMAIDVTPVKSEARPVPATEKSIQTTPTITLTKTVHFKEQKSPGQTKCTCSRLNIVNLTDLIKNICLDKAKPSSSKLEPYIRSKLGKFLAPDVSGRVKTTMNLKTKVHRALISRGAGMMDGGYKAPTTPRKLKAGRQPISKSIIAQKDLIKRGGKSAQS